MTKPRNKRTASKMQGASSAALQAVKTPPRYLNNAGTLDFTGLPDGVQFMVIDFFGVIELGTMICVSRDMNVLAKRDEYWTKHLKFLLEKWRRRGGINRTPARNRCMFLFLSARKGLRVCQSG